MSFLHVLHTHTNTHTHIYIHAHTHTHNVREVEELAKKQMLMPLRRRDFEVKAMVREIMRRGGQQRTWRLPAAPPARALATGMTNMDGYWHG